MNTDVSCVAPDDSVRDVARRMRERDLGFVPVCRSGKHVVGVITHHDLVTRVCADDLRPSAVAARDVMSRKLIAVGPQDTVEIAAEMMAVHKKSHILILDTDGGLLGIVSLADLAAAGITARAGETLRRLTAEPPSA